MKIGFFSNNIYTIVVNEPNMSKISIRPALQDGVDYLKTLYKLGIGKPSKTTPKHKPVSSKEFDLLQNPFQKSSFAKNLHWCGGNYSQNPPELNAMMIGGPRLAGRTLRRKYRSPDCVEMDGHYNTGNVRNVPNLFGWVRIEIDSGFEFMTFKPHDSSTRIKSAVAGHLPIYDGGVGLGQPIAVDYHVDYIGKDPFIPFMEAIKCNLMRGLPTVLFKNEECFMLLQCNHTSGSSYDFEGYELDGKSRNKRPNLITIKIDLRSFQTSSRPNADFFRRGVMSFVAFDPI